ncbi:hypothetical protein QEN19_003323 [Hanseniaspora menglaensis]
MKSLSSLYLLLLVQFIAKPLSGGLITSEKKIVDELQPSKNVDTESPPEGVEWQDWHMSHEHQMEEYEPEQFFALHDIKKKGYFDSNDILTMYGLQREEIIGDGDGMGSHDSSEKQIDQELKDRLVKFVFKLFDLDDNDRITKEEFLLISNQGKKFPDLGVGIGHHADFELEYEIHHWNKYHKESDPDVNVVHREDVEHDLLHHQHEIEHEENVQKGASRQTVITDDELELRINNLNIPLKFRSRGF